MDHNSQISSVFDHKKLPCLDGWRGLSILAVLFGHGWQVPGYPQILKPLSWGGASGVECFFVISGYLITTLLLREVTKYGSISLPRFYERRALRLLPAYFAFVIVIALLSFTPYQLSTHGWIGLLTFSANVYPGNESTVHFWSLAVEQQFYLIWPLILFLLVKADRSKHFLKLYCALLIPLILCPICRMAIGDTPGGGWFGHYSFIKQADILAWGCLLALIANRNANSLEKLVRRHAFKILLISLILIVCSQALLLRRFSDSFFVPFRCSISAAGFAGLIAWSIVYQSSPLGRLLNKGVLPKLGIISYSVYVWHMLFFTQPVRFGLQWAPWGNFSGFFVTSITIGWISWWILERPFFSLRSKLHAHKSR